MSIFRNIRDSRRQRDAAPDAVGPRAPILRLNPSRRIDRTDETEAEAEAHDAAEAPQERPAHDNVEPLRQPGPSVVEETQGCEPEVHEPVKKKSAPVTAPPTVLVPEKKPPIERPRIQRPPQRKKIKTRLLNADDGEVDAPAQVAAEDLAARAQVRYPVGWLVIVEGRGKGEWFTLDGGLAHIGRGEGQAIHLDFGDLTISRENHAAIAFDTARNAFLLGCGRKATPVRLNGTPVSGTLYIRNGDLIRIGETTLRLVALCDPDFIWQPTVSRGD